MERNGNGHLFAGNHRLGHGIRISVHQIGEAAGDECLSPVRSLVYQQGGNKGLRFVSLQAHCQGRLAQNVQWRLQHRRAKDQPPASIDSAIGRHVTGNGEGAHVAARRAEGLRRADGHVWPGFSLIPDGSGIEMKGAGFDVIRGPPSFLYPRPRTLGLGR